MSFWSNRLRMHGHTGWADAIVYAYDQPARLARVKSIVAKLAVKQSPPRALDFGCGVGDFSKLLLHAGFVVTGYDPFVRPSLNNARFHYAQHLNGIPLNEGTVDLAIAITVLDHILVERELNEALGCLCRLMRPEGTLIMLEYALDSEKQRLELGLSNEYQAFRTLETWERLLAEKGFILEYAEPFPHPLISPSLGFRAYSASFGVRLWRKLARFGFARRGLSLLLRIEARRALRLDSRDTATTSPSPLKFLHCKVR